MPEFDATLLTILIGICLALLVVVVVLLVRVLSILGLLERQFRQPGGIPETGESAPTSAESSAGGAFELFLSEDPARRELSKGEQFSAFRKWRQQNGMNWSNS